MTLQKFDPKTLLFFVILGIAEVYTVGAFGSVEPFFGHPSVVFRENARLLFLAVGIAGLFLLPAGKQGQVIPQFARLLSVPLLILVVWGLISVVNARSDQRMYEFIVRLVPDRPWLWGPGSESMTTSKGLVQELVIVILFMATIIRSTYSYAWRGILGSFVLCGVAVTLCGFLHKALGMEHIYGMETVLGRKQELPDIYFAPFVYNANAASFLNICTALALGLAFYQMRARPGSPVTMLWLVAGATCVIGVLLAASKAGVLIAVAQLGLFGLWQLPFLLKLWKDRKGRRIVINTEKKALYIAGAVIFGIFAIASVSTVIGRFDELIEHSKRDQGSATTSGRSAMREKVIDFVSADKLGWRGSGPGSFGHYMPYMIGPEDERLFSQLWTFAHCDPLQTIMEWGYLGALCWFFIGIGAVVRATWLGATAKAGTASAHALKGIAIALLGVGIHSTYDFPFSIFSIHIMVMALVAIAWNLQGDGQPKARKSRRKKKKAEQKAKETPVPIPTDGETTA